MEKLTVSCPHCAKLLTVLVHIKSEGTIGDDESKTSDTDKQLHWKSTLDHRQLATIRLAEANGTLAALRQALENATVDVPGNISKYFLNFLERSEQIIIPQDSLLFLAETFKGRIEVWRHQAVVGVLCDKKLMMFAPFVAIRGGSTKNGAAGVLGARHDYMPVLREWVKTKMGYVPAAGGDFANELKQKRQLGDFARPVL